MDGYQKKLKLAKEALDSGSYDKETIEYIFPELKESEDERIRKCVKRLTNGLTEEHFVRCGASLNEIHAWLEKQGEKIDAIENFDTEFEKQVSYLIASTINKEHEYNEGFVKWAANALLNYAKHELKKQDEHTYEGTFVNVDDVREEFIQEVYRILDADSTNDRANQIIYAFDSLQTIVIGNQGEQKPADKIEPKFKVGDWVVKGEVVAQILDKLKYAFVGLDTKGNNFVCNYGHADSMHLWTIQDAKDGDVLYECNEKNPFIFKELNTKHIGNIASYCDIFNGIFNPNEDDWTTLDIVPATKEQCGLLFQKMKEAGYEWDVDKKELKKIEQKPDENIEPKFKVGDTIVEKDLDECGSGTIKEIKDGKYIFEDNCFTYIKEQELWEVVKESVEPKFKVGDWIINSEGTLRYIVAVGKTGYETNKGWLTHDDYEKGFHLWTIQDAKNGDVLVWDYSKCITLFKNVVNKSAFESYFCIGSLTGEFEYGCHQHDIKGAHPATKEQRDLLFQKMKEAGYEWDAEKKELKKVKPKFKVGDVMRTLQEAADGFTDGMPVVVSIDEEYYHCNNELITIKNQDNYEYPPINRRQKPAWSEEDEQMINDIIEAIDKRYAVSDYKEMVTYLKSLKERMKGE